MGKMKELLIDIEQMLIDGYEPQEVANTFGIPLKDVLAVEERMFFDDSDFDHESDAEALASAGFGTNEDYGDFGGFDDTY
jgi:hypothetical protein